MAVIVTDDNGKSRSVEISFEEAQRVFGPMLGDAPEFLKAKYASRIKAVRDCLCELATSNSNKETCGDKMKTMYIISKANVTVDNTGCIRNIISSIHGDAYNTIEYAADEIIKLSKHYSTISSELGLNLQISMSTDEETGERCLTVSHVSYTPQGNGDKMFECETMVVFKICEVTV